MALPNFRERFESSLEEARNGPKPFDFRKELQSLLEKKHKQGMLDDRFDNLLKTQEQHLGMYLTVFCQVTGKLIADLAEHLSSPTMDCAQILYLVASLKEASNCIGCPKMEDACSQLCEACNGMNQEGCRAAFKRVKGEFVSLKLCLGSISELHGIIRQTESDISSTERMELRWFVERVLHAALLGAGFYTILALAGSLIRRK